MLDATAATLTAADVQDRPGTLLADCGYWTIANLTALPGAPELLIPPAKHGRQGKSRKDGKPSESKSDGLRAAMTAKLQSADGKARYAKRKHTVEPVFGQVKDIRGARRFQRRGLQACQAEWKLLCGTHNLLKLWRHQGRPATRHTGQHLSRWRPRHDRRWWTTSTPLWRGLPRLARPPAAYPGRP
jgi:Transposase DDE domain